MENRQEKLKQEANLGKAFFLAVKSCRRYPCPTEKHQKRGEDKWLGNLFCSANRAKLNKTATLAFFFLGATSARAQECKEDLPPELLKNLADWIGRPLASVTFNLISIVSYIFHHAPAATITAASVAAYIAISSINSNRSLSRLRETFNNLNKSNWDADVIDARGLFAEVKLETKINPQEISKYCTDFFTYNQIDKDSNKTTKDAKTLQEIFKTRNTDPETDKKAEKHNKTRRALLAILNEYENLALGVKLEIIDEEFLFRAIRGAAIADWKSLSPLVNGYRDRLQNKLAFIEFEALISAWERETSLRTGKKIKAAKKQQKFS